jgi:hypothetical protein
MDSDGTDGLWKRVSLWVLILFVAVAFLVTVILSESLFAVQFVEFTTTNRGLTRTIAAGFGLLSAPRRSASSARESSGLPNHSWFTRN